MFLLQEGAPSFIQTPADVGVESTIVTLVLWLKLAVETTGAVIIGIGVAAAYRFARSLVPPGLEGYNEIRLTLARFLALALAVGTLHEPAEGERRGIVTRREKFMTDVLVEDHVEVDELLRGVMLAFVGGDACEVYPKLDYLWARLAVHIRAEHLHLFPALLSAAEGAGRASGEPTAEEVRQSVNVLREDHDLFMRGLAEAVNELRAQLAPDVTAGPGRLPRVRENVRALAERLAEHNRLEEGQVYLWQSALLSEDARDDLRVRMRREIENLPPRFADGA